MNGITCLIDYDGKFLSKKRIELDICLFYHTNLALFIGSEYSGKYIWNFTNNNFLLIIGSAFLTKSSTHSNILIRKHAQLDSLIDGLRNGEKPENLLTGFYNLIWVDVDKKSAIIHTSHFGMRPLYYYHISTKLCVVSSNPKNIIKTNLIDSKINWSTALQFFMFNYPLSEDTLWENIFSIPAGSRLIFCQNKVSLQNYFDAITLLDKPYFKYADAINFIQDTLNRILDRYCCDIQSASLSLTGGWDGRLLLALLRNKNISINTYSHGTAHNPDVVIPSIISQKLGTNYMPYILDDEYYKNSYQYFALKTIERSCGLRSISRAHYIYSVGSELNKNQYVFTGICGSNLMKGNIKSGPVTNHLVLQFIIESDFEKIWTYLEEYTNEYIKPIINLAGIDLSNMREVLLNLHTKYKETGPLEHRLYRFILNIAERKYFGTEIMTYADHGENLSPFIDIEFVRALSQTPFFGAYIPYNTKNIYANWKSSILYAKIISRAYPELGKIASDKGVSLDDILKIYRWPWVATRQFWKRVNANRVAYFDHSKGMAPILNQISAFPNLNHKSLCEASLPSEVRQNITSFSYWAIADKNIS